MSIDEFKKRFNEIGDDQDEKAALVMEFIKLNGIEDITSKDLDTIIALYGHKIYLFEVPNIVDVYNIVSARESSKTMNRLTWVIAFFTLITTIATLYNIFSGT